MSHEQWIRKYVANAVKTTRYTWWNFVPISLFLQFTKVVNCFYVVNTVLNSIPSISTNEPVYALAVLIVLILIGMLKELLADLKRYKTDKLSNALPTQLVTGKLLDHPNHSKRAGLERRQSTTGNQDERRKAELSRLSQMQMLETRTVRADELKVGDIIKVYDDEVIPADCFILASGSSLESQSVGQCFIATSTLDGERNLKPKIAIKEMQDNFVDLVTGLDVIAEVNCKTNPIPDLYSFDADLKLVMQDKQLPIINLDLKQFVPRGAHVRNSDCLFLLVLFTGNDTKLILNQGKYRFKQSHVDQVINKVLLVNILLMLSFGVVLSYFSYKFAVENLERAPYIFQGAESPEVQAFKAFGSFFLLNNSFIPLDLAVGLEMGKVMYIYFLENDIQMTAFDVDKRDLVSCSVKNFSLHEDLAQLDYMFCDKTGTLTQNELIFKAFKIVGHAAEDDFNVDVPSFQISHPPGNQDFKTFHKIQKENAACEAREQPTLSSNKRAGRPFSSRLPSKAGDLPFLVAPASPRNVKPSPLF